HEERLAPPGSVLASPRDPAERGSHVTFDHRRFAQVTAQLWREGVIPDFRPPDGIRIGLSPLSTSFAEVEYGIDRIAELLQAPVDAPAAAARAGQGCFFENDMATPYLSG